MTTRAVAEEGEPLERRKELTDFLRTRRARLAPEQVGLPRGGRRRTPGLRREEVAELAGVGITWYTWLEQGRPINASAEVLANLADVLHLSADERAHLFLLAGRSLPPTAPQAAAGIVGPEQRAVLAALEPCPAHIRDHYWFVLTWNRAESLVASWEELPPTERHVLWNHFTNARLRQIAPDWESDAQMLLALFRMRIGPDADDPRLTTLIAQLQQISPEFRRWWPQHQVRTQRLRPITLTHPSAGQLLLTRITFTFDQEPMLSARVLVPAPGTDTTAKLQRLLNSSD